MNAPEHVTEIIRQLADDSERSIDELYAASDLDAGFYDAWKKEMVGDLPVPVYKPDLEGFGITYLRSDDVLEEWCITHLYVDSKEIMLPCPTRVAQKLVSQFYKSSTLRVLGL